MHVSPAGVGVVPFPRCSFGFHHANAWEEEEGQVVVFDTVRTEKLVVDDSSLGGNAGAAEALAGKGNRFVIEDIDYAKVATLVAQSWA